MNSRQEEELEKYVKPTPQVIPDTLESRALYAAENNRTLAILAAARELGRFLGKDVDDGSVFYHEVLPAALLATLQTVDRYAARVAAEAYLESWEPLPLPKEGWKVIRRHAQRKEVNE